MKSKTFKQVTCPQCNGNSLGGMHLDINGLVESATEKNSGFIPVKFTSCTKCKGKGTISIATPTVCMGK